MKNRIFAVTISLLAGLLAYWLTDSNFLVTCVVSVFTLFIIRAWQSWKKVERSLEI